MGVVLHHDRSMSVSMVGRPQHSLNIRDVTRIDCVFFPLHLCRRRFGLKIFYDTFSFKNTLKLIICLPLVTLLAKSNRGFISVLTARVLSSLSLRERERQAGRQIVSQTFRRLKITTLEYCKLPVTYLAPQQSISIQKKTRGT
jgi:hypothetical protein